MIVVTAALCLLNGQLGHAANILNNGSFESDFAGWTQTGDVAIDNISGENSSGNKSAKFHATGALDGQLVQTFATTAGQRYLLQYDVGVVGTGDGSQGLEAKVTGVNTLLDDFSDFAADSGYHTRYKVFTADSASTTMTVTDASGSGNSPVPWLDDVRVIPLPLPTHSGKYIGTIKVTKVFPAEGISSFHREGIVARVSASGQIAFITQPGGHAETGVITSDGNIYIGSDLSQQGTAVFAGNKLTITVSDSESFDGPISESEADQTAVVILHRVGP